MATKSFLSPTEHRIIKNFSQFILWFLLFSFFYLIANFYNERAALEQYLLREAANSDCRDCVYFTIRDICTSSSPVSATYFFNFIFLLAAFLFLQTARLRNFLFAALFHAASLGVYVLWFFSTYSYFVYESAPKRFPNSVANYIFLGSTWTDVALFTFVLMIFVFQIYHLFRLAVEKTDAFRKFS